MGTATCSPLLVVFDLDFTMWPFGVDKVSPPFTKKDDEIVDSSGVVMKPHPDSPAIFERLHEEGIKIGVASRTHLIEDAKHLVNLFDWTKYISYCQIYPGSKLSHFKKIREDSGIEYSQMMFFDDDDENIKEVGTLGVFCVDVPNGISMKLLDDSLKLFAQSRAK